MLMARSMNLPVIFLIENNEWSMATRIEQRRCPIDLSLFAESLDIHYAHLEGNDPYLYIDALKDLRKFSIKNSVPVCVEVNVLTLDKFTMKTPENPGGEIIHPHMGASPGVSLDNGPIIKEGIEDPVFVLAGHFKKSVVEEIARTQRAALEKELA